MTDRGPLLSLIAGMAIASAAASAQAADNELYFYQLPFDLEAEARPGDGLQVTIDSRDAAGLGLLLERSTVDVDSIGRGSVRATLHGRDTWLAAPGDAHLAATFLIDFDEPATRELVAKIGEPGEGLAAVHTLSDFVHERIKRSHYVRGFDVASVVARDMVGDCTEHAVLLTALARAKGFPARAVLGTVIFAGADNAGAFGHAWSEIWADGAWHLADATLPTDADGVTAYYLPLGPIADEGMGYTIGLVSTLSALPGSIRDARPVAGQGLN